MKICTKCKQIKSINEFHKNIMRCKLCIKQYQQENAERIKQKQKQYRQRNIEKIKEHKKQYYKENIEMFKNYQTSYYKENCTKIKKYSHLYREHRKTIDPLFKFANNVRILISKSFKRNKHNFRKQTKTQDLLGCSIPELYIYLEKLFQPGMSFDNHGEWHIDHIIPLASGKTQEEIEKLCHYTNLQPLWATDNFKKGAKF